jgi:hypothetical protein
MKMDTMTARALSLGIVVAVWTAISHYAKLPLQLWPVIVGLGCFVAAEGGIPGLQRTLAGTISGVVWALIAYTVSLSLGRSNIVDALVYGAAVVGMVLQARVPLLSYTGGVIVGAAAAMGAGVRSLEGAVRVAAALAIGALLGYAAEYGAEKIREFQKRR